MSKSSRLVDQARPDSSRYSRLDEQPRLGMSLKRSQLDRAVPLLERTLELYRGQPGKDQFMLLITQRNLARAYERARRFHDAELLYSKTIEAAGGDHPSNDRFYSGTLALLGRCLTHEGKFTEAVSVLRQSLTIKEKIQPTDWTTANTKSLLGEALTGEKSFVEAEPLLLVAEEALSKLQSKMRPIDRSPTLRGSRPRAWLTCMKPGGSASLPRNGR